MIKCGLHNGTDPDCHVCIWDELIGNVPKRRRRRLRILPVPAPPLFRAEEEHELENLLARVPAQPPWLTGPVVYTSNTTTYALPSTETLARMTGDTVIYNPPVPVSQCRICREQPGLIHVHSVPPSS